MRTGTVLGLLGLASYAAAFPVELWKRQNSTTDGGNTTLSELPTNGTFGSNVVNTTGVTDVDVLQFALFLEQLELAFYRSGVEPYSDSDFANAGKQSWVRQRFTEIIAQEQTHVQVIKSAIAQSGGTPATACTYNFGVSSVSSFLMMAEQINDVGPGAYTGSAALISNKTILTQAAQILAIEARHNAWVRDVNSDDAFPQTFQVALTPKQAFTVASQFVVSCPSNNTQLVVTAAPNLAVMPPSNTSTYSIGETVTLMKGVPFGPSYGVGNATYTPATAPAPTAFNQTGLYAAFLGGSAGQANYTFLPLPSSGQITIPTGISGQSYVVVTNSATSVTDESTVAGPAIITVPISAQTFTYQESGPNSY